MHAFASVCAAAAVPAVLAVPTGAAAAGTVQTSVIGTNYLGYGSESGSTGPYPVGLNNDNYLSSKVGKNKFQFTAVNSTYLQTFSSAPSFYGWLQPVSSTAECLVVQDYISGVQTTRFRTQACSYADDASQEKQTFLANRDSSGSAPTGGVTFIAANHVAQGQNYLISTDSNGEIVATLGTGSADAGQLKLYSA